MKIAIIVPSEDHFATAGVRIRYQRLKPRLEAAGHRFELVPIDTVDARSEHSFNTYIFCKCHDARSLILADALARAGLHVGVDFFDDYYSQTRDSRFVHLREWLRNIAPSLSFAICSTERMRAGLTVLLPDLPFHIINDPCDGLDPDHVAASIEKNVERALSTRQLDVGWFGMGDNPHFPVGLSDLFAFSEILMQSRRWGFEPRLSVLTNKRSMTAERLEMLARLPVACALEEWTEELEGQLIANSLLCFLPVNAQPFSTVKSLNRAITTLASGAQALSTGYPLYAELDSFIYRDLGTLISDVERGAPALRRETIPKLLESLEALGNPDVEASKLISFLGNMHPLQAESAPSTSVQAVVHGVGALSIVHKLAQRIDLLSVASPLTSLELDFDVRIDFDPSTGGTSAVLSDAALRLLPEPVRQRTAPCPTGGKRNLYQLVLENPGWETEDLFLDENARSMSVALSTYASRMEATLAGLRSLFGPIRVYVSESRSPYWPHTHRRPVCIDTAFRAQMDAA
ncbi:hypothetical protein [Microvirga roseola]|uniref:hypothetical protein n=1 Tax=Microvirga roseola TaxID=2883126 RepID=UPI001E4BAFEE|nr:hypothetical protein [Microvirga roseola]